MKKRYVLRGSAPNHKRRPLELLTMNIGSGDKIRTVNYVHNFSHYCKSKKEGIFILERTAWALAGNRKELKSYLKEIKKENRITYDDVSLDLESFIGDD